MRCDVCACPDTKVVLCREYVRESCGDVYFPSGARLEGPCIGCTSSGLCMFMKLRGKSCVHMTCTGVASYLSCVTTAVSWGRKRRTLRSSWLPSSPQSARLLLRRSTS